MFENQSRVVQSRPAHTTPGGPGRLGILENPELLLMESPARPLPLSRGREMARITLPGRRRPGMQARTGLEKMPG